MSSTKDDKRLLKVSRELSIELRHKVFILYDGSTYGNLGKEVEEAIKNHIGILDKKITAKQLAQPNSVDKFNFKATIPEQKEEPKEQVVEAKPEPEKKKKKIVKLAY